MSTMQRDKQPKGNGKAPAFQIRILPELKAQFEEAAKAQGMSLGNWFKNLGREELKRLGSMPKG
ncbi:toxin-antitoxin system HicB family antitoxin [Cronobacter dublinensis]|uniref:toxin-antitoxin system HicB family antitoxin n=1 Tax=Cronobacter dublinensis TaxID=413497 RepID=UPI000CFD2E5B|nr:toxin-antitoxin system HicB family antitoxin [Cronobacter dublinensis]MDK1194163.1 toxin-antitoxin system HicB family antitoxin [Cronobacter dublinensis]MDK1199501.1 toxin-antitoxin system HicB family antitoxin [Cronobacter dublinensis]MDK1203800.1 toxin-antitoxin system HicB family antitoxin [Cronobacter dublinensis]